MALVLALREGMVWVTMGTQHGDQHRSETTAAYTYAWVESDVKLLWIPVSRDVECTATEVK